MINILNHKMKKIVVAAFVLITMVSCRIEGLTNDYGKLTLEQKNKIIALKSFDSIKPNFIYKITGSQLKEELKKYPKSIVYIFTNGCTSNFCKPIKIYENYAKEHNYKLFLIMNGYASLDETLNQPYESTLFSIDNDYYNSNIRNNYARYFENDILNKPIKEKTKEYLGNIYFFEKEQLVKVVNELP